MLSFSRREVLPPISYSKPAPAGAQSFESTSNPACLALFSLWSESRTIEIGSSPSKLFQVRESDRFTRRYAQTHRSQKKKLDHHQQSPKTQKRSHTTREINSIPPAIIIIMGPTRRPSLGECAVDVAFIGDHQPEEAKNFWTETKLFLELAIPTSFLGLGFTLSPLLTASYVGLRFGPVFLSAFTLGNLTGNLCTFSLLAGLLSAADTLGPQAFGVGDYREVGLIALRGIFASIIIILPINVLLVLHMEKALVAVGQDPEAAFHASEWYRVFVYALPFVVLYQVTWKFLSAQHVMRPLIYVSVFSCLLVLPLALEYCTAYYGFVGSATAYVIFQASQSLLLILYIAVCKPHVAETWPGLGCWREALKVKQLMEYLNLGGGGILCQSEWIYWEALGLMVGNMGVVPLSAHTIPNQITMIMCMIPFSFGTALAIRMGHILPKSVVHTKHIAVVMTLISSVLMALIALLAYVEADWIFALFTKDAEVLAMAHSIWWKVSPYLVFVNPKKDIDVCF